MNDLFARLRLLGRGGRGYQASDFCYSNFNAGAVSMSLSVGRAVSRGQRVSSCWYERVSVIRGAGRIYVSSILSKEKSR